MTSEEVAVELMHHNDRLEVVERGVSNFRKFQLDIAGKIGFVYGAAKVASIIGALFLVFLVWALSLVLPAAKIVIDEYYRNHPAAKVQKSSQLNPSDPLNARSNHYEVSIGGPYAH